MVFRYHDINITEISTTDTFGWRRKFKKEEGRCFSYNFSDELRQLTVIGINIRLVSPIDIYLHHPGQFLTWNIYSLTSRIQEQTYVDVAHEVEIFS